MKKIYKISISAIIFVFLLSFSAIVYADSVVKATGCSNTADYSKSSSFTPLIQCGGLKEDGSSQHCCDFTEAAILINRIINWFISLSATIAAITFSIAGARILMNPENPAKLQEGWEMFQKTVIGLLIVLGAWLAVHVVIGALVSNSTGATGALRFFSN